MKKLLKEYLNQPTKNCVRITVRLPEEVHKNVIALAKVNNRSLNQVIAASVDKACTEALRRRKKAG